ncbi:spermidine synthase [Cellvibrio polysaccharolyticus]|nr:fused MFS/spermidine synthase [Cellvibrio polysaccharolyticus]
MLPLFGGGASIWTACMFFFQGLLLCGYFYSYCLTKLANVRLQVGLHALLSIFSLLALPLSVNLLYEASTEAPLKNIILLLATSVGLPYVILSSTGPLIQRWLTYGNQEKPPYFLYSLSNVGSLLAVLSYPFVFEPFLSLSAQTAFWSVGYGVYAAAILAVCLSMYKKNPLLLAEPQAMAATGQAVRSRIFLWLLLPAVGVVLLLATTNSMTQNVQPVPFLWLMPLCIYLLTYIISFHSHRWYVRWYWFAVFMATSVVAIVMFFIGSWFNLFSQLAIYSLILLSACMICHGELALLKPGAERLTLFYLMISLGGVLGSAFVVFFAQTLFSNYYEFPLAIITVFFLVAGCVLWQRGEYHLPQEKRPLLLAQLAIVYPLVLGGGFFYLNTLNNQNDVLAVRNFYGILKAKDVEVNGRLERRLIDGTTSHGTQLLAADATGTPVSYYRRGTGVALALEHLPVSDNMQVGIIGLGAGTLAAYGRPGDTYRFYELNPQVKAFANNQFTYLADSDADIDIVLGDARVSMARKLAEEGGDNYDVLVVDAFSSGAIPAHLLTKEAFELYWNHLKPAGALAVHISNSHLNLSPLVREIALSMNKSARYFKVLADDDDVNDAEWVVIAADESFFKHPEIAQQVVSWPENTRNTTIWTDDYSNLLSVVK